MNSLSTTLDVRRPSKKWTTLFRHDAYAPALWALLFSPEDAVYNHNDDDHLAGFLTTVGQARHRLVARLEPLRQFDGVWRPVSLASALALCIAGVPDEWPLRFDADGVVRQQGNSFGSLLQIGVQQAASLAPDPPTSEGDATARFVALIHALNPETLLASPLDGQPLEHAWPAEPLVVEGQLLGVPVECPTSHVEAMTRSRRRWQASW